MYNPGGPPSFGYGIYSIHKWGDLSITQNTLEAVSSLPPNNVSLVHISMNHQLGGTMPYHPVVTCNSTKNSNIGFRFLGQNGHTQWEGNIMCNHWAGLGIYKGSIGKQGGPATASGNFWEYTGPCSKWGNFPIAGYETYLEDCDPIFSELWVYNTTLVTAPTGLQGYYPNSNGASGSPNIPYIPGVTLHTVAIQSLNNPDCVASSYAPPIWRKGEHLKTEILESDKGLDKLSVFPNPTTGELRITSGLRAIKFVSVMDVSGKRVNESNFNESNVIVDLSYLAQGIYIVEIFTEEEVARRKIVITK